MNAAVVHSFDTPPRFEPFAEPVPQEGEVLVHVRAAGLHRIVRSLAAGSHYGSTGKLPFIPGVDGVGHLENGSRVYFGAIRNPFGTFSERAVSPFTVPLPDGLEDATAAGMTNPGVSSWVALSRAQFIAGESVLVLGATGTSGRLALQAAKRLGARRIVAVGRNPETLDTLQALGADAVISLSQEHDALVAAFREVLKADPVDVVLDYLWGAPAEALIEAISQKGFARSSRVRHVQVGAMAGSSIQLPAAALRSSGLELLGSGFGSASMDDIQRGIRAFFAEAARAPFVAEIQTAPLSEVESLWKGEGKAERLVFQP